MSMMAPCPPGQHQWQYETTLTPPVSGSSANATVYRCLTCSYSWNGATAGLREGDTTLVVELIERTPTPEEAADAIVAHYTGESIPGVKNVEARNRRLRRRLHG